MATKLNPYILFKGNAREAMEFYKSVFGGTLTMNTYQEGMASQDPSQGNLIMHAQLETENGLTLMGSDGPGDDYRPGTNISISLSGDNEAELSSYYQKLAAGGTVLEPLVKAPWGDTFGMVTDQYGLTWMVNIAGEGVSQ